MRPGILDRRLQAGQEAGARLAAFSTKRSSSMNLQVALAHGHVTRFPPGRVDPARHAEHVVGLDVDPAAADHAAGLHLLAEREQVGLDARSARGPENGREPTPDCTSSKMSKASFSSAAA